MKLRECDQCDVQVAEDDIRAGYKPWFEIEWPRMTEVAEVCSPVCAQKAIAAFLDNWAKEPDDEEDA